MRTDSDSDMNMANSNEFLVSMLWCCSLLGDKKSILHVKFVLR